MVMTKDEAISILTHLRASRQGTVARLQSKKRPKRATPAEMAATIKFYEQQISALNLAVESLQ